MKLQTRKAQFFLVALLLLALSMFVLFSFFRTTDTASVTLFEKSSLLEVDNIENAIEDKNNWLDDNNWWNASWAYRKIITVTDAGTDTPDQFNDVEFPAGHILDCDKELIIINTSDNCYGADTSCEVKDAEVLGTAPNCDFVMISKTSTIYHIYYGNPDAKTPSRGSYATSELPTYTVSDEQVANLCEHFKYLYPSQGIRLECGVVNSFSSNQRANYSINFTSFDLQFKGYIN